MYRYMYISYTVQTATRGQANKCTRKYDLNVISFSVFRDGGIKWSDSSLLNSVSTNACSRAQMPVHMKKRKTCL